MTAVNGRPIRVDDGAAGSPPVAVAAAAAEHAARQANPVFRAGIALLERLSDYHQYQAVGLSRALASGGPLVVACNHSLATYDAVLLALAGYRASGRWFHAMADRLFFRLPGVGRVFSTMGFVEGTRARAMALLAQGEVLGVLPGGMRDALRSSRQRYTFDWSGRLGFVWLSLTSGAPIVLAACPRADDIFAVKESRLTALAYHKLRLPLPLFRGRGPTPIPRPVPLWHVLSEPIAPPVPPDRVTERDVVAHHQLLCRRMSALMQEALDYRPQLQEPAMIVVRLEPSAGDALARRRDFARFIHRDPSRGDCFTSQATHRELARRGLLRRAGTPRPFEPEAGALAAARARLILGWSVAVGEPLPEEVAEEVALWLLARPDEEFEYMGRGRFEGRTPGEIHYFDRPGGRRSYAFRAISRGDASARERSERVSQDLEQRSRWLNDPEARVVLSIGGGGYRLFAAVAAVKAIERMLGGDRRKISEVWGSSGGAMLGYTFSRGHALSAVDRLGFGLYHGERKELPGLHLRSLAHFASQVVRDWRRGTAGSPELGAWVGAIDELSPPAQEPAIPFYSLVSNSRRRYPIAFAEQAHIPDYCKDFLLPCNSRDATAASMAVPFLFRPLRGVLPGADDDHWFDGSVVEENPMLLPFIKWQRDRRYAPERTPKKLKIALVNLNLRLSESGALARLADGGGGARLASKAFDLMDLVLDSKTHAHLRTLTEVEGVEIMTATLTLGRMNFITRAAIPGMIRSGQIMEGWRLEMFDGSSNPGAR